MSEPPPPATTRRRSLRRAFIGRRPATILAQAVAAALAIVLLIWRVDIFDAFRRLPEVELVWAVPALALLTVTRVIYGYRWRLLMWRHENLPVPQLSAIFILAQVLNWLIPFRAGDLMRIQLPHRRFNIPRPELTTNVMLTETLLDAVAFALLLFTVLPFMAVPLLSRPEVAVSVTVAIGAFLVLVWLARSDTSRDYREARPFRWLPEASRARAGVWVPELLDGLNSLDNLSRTLQLIALSVAARLADAVVFWMIGLSFGLDLRFVDYVVVMIAIGLIGTMPLVPWNIGPYEIAVTEVASLLGASRLDASTLAIGSHLLTMGWMLVLGLVAMRLLRLRLRDLTW